MRISTGYLLIYWAVFFSPVFAAAQRVGIQTMAPAAKLQINGTSSGSVPLLLLYDSLKANGSYQLGFSKQAISNYWHVLANTDASQANAYLRFNYAGLNKLHLGADGKLSVGTASPQAAFHLNTSNQVTGFIDGGNNMYVSLAEEGQNNGYFGSFSGAINDIDFGTYSGNNFARLNLVTGDTARIMIDSTGWVGAGVSNPRNNLSIKGGLIVDANNQNGINGSGNWLRFGSNSGEGIGSNKNPASVNYNGLDFYTNSQPRLSILSNGNAGIGTTNPQAKLHVAGSVKVSQYNYLREKLQGVLTVGSSSSDSKTVQITFNFIPAMEDWLPPYNYISQLYITVQQENLNVSDAFIAQVQRYDPADGFTVKITRVDANANGTGWGQNLKLHWMFLN